MATFKICAQKMRNDGFYPVYIRVTHKRRLAFVKTDKMTDKKGMDRNGGIKDTFILSYCSDEKRKDELQKEINILKKKW